MIGGSVTTSKLAVLFVALAVAAGAAGCNTVKGAGRDVQGAGKAVEKASDKTKREIHDHD